jgi:hypothetical protein
MVHVNGSETLNNLAVDNPLAGSLKIEKMLALLVSKVWPAKLALHLSLHRGR